MLQVIVGNSRLYANVVHATPDAQVDDGMLDVTIVPAGDLQLAVRLGWSLALRRRPDGDVPRFRGRELALSAAIAPPMEVDGSPVRRRSLEGTAGRPFRIVVEPLALAVRVPRSYRGGLFASAPGRRGAGGNRAGDRRRRDSRRGSDARLRRTPTRPGSVRPARDPGEQVGRARDPRPAGRTPPGHAGPGEIVQRLGERHVEPQGGELPVELGLRARRAQRRRQRLGVAERDTPARPSAGISSRWPIPRQDREAERSPQPRRPGNPSAASPTSASQSGMLSGSTPKRDRTASASIVRSRRRSNAITRPSARTHWARSLSGDRITTRSTPGASAHRAAAVASASSASYSVIGQTTRPSDRRAASARPNWASSSGGMPASVLYPA